MLPEESGKKTEEKAIGACEQPEKLSEIRLSGETLYEGRL